MRRLLVILPFLLLASFIAGCGPTAVSPTETEPAPAVTPTAAYNDYIGIGGYLFITREAVGDIAAGRRVRISSARFDGTDTIYRIVAEDEATQADARQSQITFAPDVTPGPTPTQEELPPTDAPTEASAATPAAAMPAGAPPAGAFADYVGVDGYPMVTTEAVPPVDAGARVRISHIYIEGETLLYGIVAEDEQTIALAREDQLAVAPPGEE